jgi:leucyl-tRNA synthetase
MVTHETYRRQNGEWIDPSQVEIESEGATRRARIRTTGEPVTIGDIEKMSKSKRNVVAPADLADSYGVDAARLCVLSDSPPERDVQWTAAGVEGAWRLVNRVWAEFDTETTADSADPAREVELRRATHRAIKAVTDAIEGWRFNSAIARLHEFVGVVRRYPKPGLARSEALAALASLIAPFAPHLAEECWVRLGERGLIAASAWPAYDPALAEDDERVLPVQINGKRRGEIRVGVGATEAEVQKIVLDDPEIARRLEGLSIRRVIVVKDRIVNIVAA